MAGPAFLGVGWGFPIKPDPSGKLAYVDGDANVEQSLEILLQTSLGERVMRPDFGTQAPRLVFAPGSQQFLSLLEQTVRDAIVNWEPRVDVDQVLAEADPADPAHVTVSLDYTIRQTNTRKNLVYPFYLGVIEPP
ncbi:MAG TPA: GPW/gp25 family protein [Methylomirabilota bacterium]|nr:GPW/gp25 family protein [Methylomirabilota bacterium]